MFETDEQVYRQQQKNLLFLLVKNPSRVITLAGDQFLPGRSHGGGRAMAAVLRAPRADGGRYHQL